MSIASSLLRAGVRGYQLFVSPLLPPSCKFAPTCSCYAVTALDRHGALKGLALSAWRILRCNPWTQGGFDPVPPVHGRAGGHDHAHDADHVPAPRHGAPHS